jgi:hypothetical protein
MRGRKKEKDPLALSSPRRGEEIKSPLLCGERVRVRGN